MEKYSIRIIIERQDETKKEIKNDFGGWLIGSFDTLQEAHNFVENSLLKKE